MTYRQLVAFSSPIDQIDMQNRLRLADVPSVGRCKGYERSQGESADSHERTALLDRSHTRRRYERSLLQFAAFLHGKKVFDVSPVKIFSMNPVSWVILEHALTSGYPCVS